MIQVIEADQKHTVFHVLGLLSLVLSSWPLWQGASYSLVEWAWLLMFVTSLLAAYLASKWWLLLSGIQAALSVLVVAEGFKAA